MAKKLTQKLVKLHLLHRFQLSSLQMRIDQFQGPFVVDQMSYGKPPLLLAK